MERRLEKTRSLNRCSVASSNSKARNKSLESGVMLCRLNHELFPEPGSPMAKITTPFGRAPAAGDVPVTLGACGALIVSGAFSFEGEAVAVCPEAVTGRAPLPPRPRPPRPLLRLRRRFASAAGDCD